MKNKLIWLAVLAAVVLLLLNISNGNLKIDALTGPSKHKHSHARVVLPERDTYTMYLNKTKLANAGAIKVVLEGEDVTIRPCTVTCTVSKDDKNAQTFAKLLQKRGKAKGLTLNIEEQDALMAVSKAEDGRVPMLLVSSATKERYSTDTLEKKDFTVVLEAGGKQLEES